MRKSRKKEGKVRVREQGVKEKKKEEEEGVVGQIEGDLGQGNREEEGRQEVEE